MKGKKTGGRQKGSLNKMTADIKALAQQHTPAAISALVTIMRDLKAPPGVRVAAIKELLDRGHGKPPMSVAVTAENEHKFVVVLPQTYPETEAGAVAWEREAQKVLGASNQPPVIEVAPEPPKADLSPEERRELNRRARPVEPVDFIDPRAEPPRPDFDRMVGRMPPLTKWDRN